jgi:hypothetical protein
MILSQNGDSARMLLTIAPRYTCRGETVFGHSGTRISKLSLKRIPLVLEPAGGMLAVRVVVRPVYDTSVRIPLILPSELYEVAFLQTSYARRDIEVVCDEQSLARARYQDETLVP